MNQQSLLQLLGLAQVAGGLDSGEDTVMRDIRHGQACLVLLATDASEKTKKRIQDKCHTYEVPLDIRFTREELSHALGKKRTICCFTDKGFAGSYQKKVKKIDQTIQDIGEFTMRN